VRRDMARKAHFMRYHDHGFPLFRQLLHNTQHFAHQFRVKRRRRFIKQQYVGLHRQRAGNGNTLLLAAGEVHRIFNLLAFVNTDFCQIFDRPIAGFLFAQA